MGLDLYLKFDFEETWKPIPDFLGYEASTWGRIRSVIHEVERVYHGKLSSQTIKGRLLKPWKSRMYLMVGLGAKARFLVHHLVAITFNEPRPKGAQCRHLNGKHYDNRPENLAWGTFEENWEDSIRLGEKRARMKLTKEQVLEVRNTYKNAKRGKRGQISHGICQELAQKYGVTTTSISNIVSKRTWKSL